MKIPIASDHAGFEAKTKIISKLQEMGYKVEDFGPFTDERVDYPDYAVKVSEAVNNGHQPIGILICGSGQGMCMTANKFENVRAALVYDAEVASLTRQHNDANIICLPGRSLSDAELSAILEAYLSAKFEGGRHTERVNKIKALTTKASH
jgi:ribose 5-phosphate isomerase B